MQEALLHGDATPVLREQEWREARQRHRERVDGWIQARRERASLNRPHPVYDFLFTYYPFRPAQLRRWSPGCGVVLEGCRGEDLEWADDAVMTAHGTVIPAHSFPTHRQEYLRWAVRYLEATSTRAPSFCCFGLHEWAMVYRCEEQRHRQVPLRLSHAEIDRVVEGGELRCTHFDAYRFFTPSAVPLNRQPLSREETVSMDQRGCIHVTMDLYRFAFKVAPWCSSDLVADAFLLAADARAIDMRASPYDLRSFGFEAIPIESATGREAYIGEQRALAERAVPIRERLLTMYRGLLEGSVGERDTASVGCV
jgi:hypothetical protein